MDVLHLDSVIETAGRYKGKTVQDVIDKKKSAIFQLIKKGVMFDDEVLKICNITKTIRDVRVYNVIVEHEKSTKKYEKDTASIKEIMKEINTLEYNDVIIDDSEGPETENEENTNLDLE